MKTIIAFVYGLIVGVVLLLIGAAMLLMCTLLPYIGYSILILTVIGAFIYDTFKKEN